MTTPPMPPEPPVPPRSPGPYETGPYQAGPYQADPYEAGPHGTEAGPPDPTGPPAPGVPAPGSPPDAVSRTAPAPDALAVIAGAIGELREEMVSLNDQFRRRLLNNREARRGLDELHDELEHSRKSAEGRTLQPLLYDLVLLLDRVERESGGFAESVEEELITLLEKYGLTRIRPAAGPFDPSCQEGIGTVRAVEPEQHGRVAEVVRHGYRMGERVVRPQQVRVYRA